MFPTTPPRIPYTSTLALSMSPPHMQPLVTVGGHRRSQSCLKKETKAKPFDGIPAFELPRTIVDAIYVTRELGLRYFWVDVLCIIQDSNEDRAKEINQTAHIYQQAYVTIAAASAEAVGEGFIRPRSTICRTAAGTGCPSKTRAQSTDHPTADLWYMCQKASPQQARVDPPGECSFSSGPDVRQLPP